MPVSYWPLIFPALLIGVPLLFLVRGSRHFWRAAAFSAVILLLLFASVFVPGWILMIRAHHGDPAAMYELARWTENHNEVIGEYVLWGYESDVVGGFYWLQKAADLGYAPALYAVGVRVKKGLHVPRPPTWDGPAGNSFAQPSRGQLLIDKAIQLGYQPTTPEEAFYSEYRAAPIGPAPYWAIVIPLTVLSAWLLRPKPRAPKPESN